MIRSNCQQDLFPKLQLLRLKTLSLQAKNISKSLSTKRRWSRGMILACHAGDPGSNPGRRIFFLKKFCSSKNRERKAPRQSWIGCFRYSSYMQWRINSYFFFWKKIKICSSKKFFFCSRKIIFRKNQRRKIILSAEQK